MSLCAGWDEIIRLKEQLEGRQSALSGSKYMVLPLHSMVPAAEQRKVFKRPQAGVRKVVLATNIAETVRAIAVSCAALLPPLSLWFTAYLVLFSRLKTAEKV